MERFERGSRRRDPSLNPVLKLAEYIASDNRFPESEHHLRVRSLISNLLGELGDFRTQKFKYELLKPISGKLDTGVETLKGLPYTNSPSAKVAGEVVDCGYATPSELSGLHLKGKIALVKEGKLPFCRKELLLKRKGVVGIIVYRSEVDDIYAGLSAGTLPVLALPRSSAVRLYGFVRLETITERVKPEGQNFWIDLGNRRSAHTLTLIAHYDTKPYTKGAIDNALSVALLLTLAAELARDKISRPYKIRFLFTDAEEFGLLGAKSFVSLLTERELKNTVAVSVDTVGWSTPAILVRDGEGENDLHLVESVSNMLSHLGIRKFFSFTAGRSGRSDHIPFRQKGARTLFFASNPFPFRHTSFDNFSIVDPKATELWLSFLRFFIKNFHRRGTVKG